MVILVRTLPAFMILVQRLLDPRPGTTRIKIKFAWLPVKAGGALIWLQRYQIMEAYVVMTFLINVNSIDTNVKFGEWKRVSTRLMK